MQIFGADSAEARYQLPTVAVRSREVDSQLSCMHRRTECWSLISNTDEHSKVGEAAPAHPSRRDRSLDR